MRMSLQRVLGVVFIVLPFASVQADQLDVLREMQTAFVKEVGGVVIDPVYRDKLLRQTEDIVRRNGEKFVSSQFFLFVDRNHSAQKAFLVFYDAENKSVTFIGGEKASTGNPKRSGYFETPTGVFENNPTNMSYRALGTKNKLGWRGLGAKGSRVWDLGWQRTVKGHGEPMDIRLLVHATDPEFGESRLGSIQSKGCIRISARFNKFLDYHGVLDREYEGTTKASYVLLKKREPVSFAGKFIVVIDSGES